MLLKFLQTTAMDATYEALLKLASKMDKHVLAAHFEIKYLDHNELQRQATDTIVVTNHVDPVWSVEAYIMSKYKVWRVQEIKIEFSPQKTTISKGYSYRSEKFSYLNTTSGRK